MGTFLRDALKARLEWVNVAAFEGVGEWRGETKNAIEAGLDAVRDLAFAAVQNGMEADAKPHILADVPVLVMHFGVARQVCAELQYLSRYGGPTSRITSNWLGNGGGSLTPYTGWLAEVALHIADLMQMPCSPATTALHGAGVPLLYAWGEGMEARQAAELAHLAYVDHMEMEEEEERRQRYVDEADYYGCVEADLWRGWRDEYEEELKLESENDSPTGCLSKKVIEDH